MDSPTTSILHEMAFLVAKRSTCLRRKVGAVVVKDKRVLSTGYNGSPKGTMHCEELGCIRDQMDVPSGTRHELAEGARRAERRHTGRILRGQHKDSTVYTTTYPCSMCAKIMINAGVKEIVYCEGYVDALSEMLFAETNIIVREYPMCGAVIAPKTDERD